MRKDDCIFCQIVEGHAPAHVVWEDEAHLAFLTIVPNTEGFTVVITKEHEPSYFAEAEESVALNLLKATRAVAKKLDAAFPDVGRSGLVFEGFGVDHLHAKVIPLHGTISDAWRQHASDVRKYFTTYEGYISSHNHERADDAVLAETARKIRESGS